MGNLILRLRKVGASLGQGWGKVSGKVGARSGQGWGKVRAKSKVRARLGQARLGQGWGKVGARLGQGLDKKQAWGKLAALITPASIIYKSLYHYLLIYSPIYPHHLSIPLSIPITYQSLYHYPLIYSPISITYSISVL